MATTRALSPWKIRRSRIVLPTEDMVSVPVRSTDCRCGTYMNPTVRRPEGPSKEPREKDDDSHPDREGDPQPPKPRQGGDSVLHTDSAPHRPHRVADGKG